MPHLDKGNVAFLVIVYDNVIIKYNFLYSLKQRGLFQKRNSPFFFALRRSKQYFYERGVSTVIDITVTTTKGVEAAEKNLQQAKNRLAMEKKKANEERRI